VATANDVSRLPPELLRRGRFDELFFVDLPTPPRAGHLGAAPAQAGRDPDAFDLAALAESTEHFSGAELEQVVVGALHRAFAAGARWRPSTSGGWPRTSCPSSGPTREIKALREWARGGRAPRGARVRWGARSGAGGVTKHEGDPRRGVAGAPQAARRQVGDFGVAVPSRSTPRRRRWPCPSRCARRASTCSGPGHLADARRGRVFAVYKMEVIVRAQNLAVRDTHWGVVLFALVVILLA